MSAPVFVDTNVLIYCRDASEEDKQVRAMEWMTHLWRTRTGRLSIQVLQEFYAVVTGKLDPGLDVEMARADVRSLLAWDPIRIDASVIEASWSLQDHHGLSWWDALIVSAARVGGCGYLLTEDLQPGQRFGGILVISPFEASPDSLRS
jgi:predicted nucleic acid-binding protein